MDAKWYRDALAVYAHAPQGKERPEKNLAWERCSRLIGGQQPCCSWPTRCSRCCARRDRTRGGVTAQVLGAGDEYKAGARHRPPPPCRSSSRSTSPRRRISRTPTTRWTSRPRSCATEPGTRERATLAKNGVTFALTANGLKDVKTFRANVGKRSSVGLTPTRRWRRARPRRRGCSGSRTGWGPSLRARSPTSR